MPEYICAFDMGTTGVKAGILTPEGRVMSTAYREYTVKFPGRQWVEQSIDEMWQAQCEASHEMFAQSEIDPADIAAAAVSDQRATFAAVDKDERPLTRFIGWQDRRSIEQCEEMKRTIGEQRYYRIAGLPIEPVAAVSKMLWLKENAPEVFEKTDKFVATQCIHLNRLGVEKAPCDLPDAAYMGLLDVDKLQWSEELLNLLGIPGEKMPALVHSGEVVGQISAKAAEATGLAKGTPIVAAGGDHQCSALGVGVAQPGFVSVGIGTGGGVLIYADKPQRHPDLALNCLPHAVQGAWEMEGICLASGAVYKWFRDTLGALEREAASKLDIDAYDLLNVEASGSPAGANSLIVLPSFIGAGSPNWYPKARGVVLGLTMETERKHLIRAMLEGICLEIRWVLESVENLGTKLSEVRIWGGAAKSPFWNQIAANIYGVPAAKTEISEAGLVGAAICAGVGIKLFNNAQEGAQAMVQLAERYEPDPKLRLRYNEMFAIYKEAYNALVDAGVFDRIAAL